MPTNCLRVLLIVSLKSIFVSFLVINSLHLGHLFLLFSPCFFLAVFLSFVSIYTYVVSLLMLRFLCFPRFLISSSLFRASPLPLSVSFHVYIIFSFRFLLVCSRYSLFIVHLSVLFFRFTLILIYPFTCRSSAFISFWSYCFFPAFVPICLLSRTSLVY